ncbi:MAG: EFR1 family ferrodoxin, partial [Methanocorpusculum sp.]|nr:EFR1 family ferrodoxin [Methanocorpusculum sp.]
GLPSTVLEFVSRAEFRWGEKPYVYAVATCGSGTGNANQMLADALAARGTELSGRFALRMVDNYVPLLSLPSEEGVAELLSMADEDLTGILGQIEARECGDFDCLKGRFPALRTRFSYPKYERIRHTKNFRVLPSCVGCGRCAERCNSEAIAIREKHPVWVKESCNLCLACLHRCPVSAIEFGNMTVNHGIYMNPKAVWPKNARDK